MANVEEFLQLYIEKHGKKGLFTRMNFNRSFNQYKEVQERLGTLTGNSLSEYELFETYLELRKSLDKEKLKNAIQNEEVSDMAELVEKIKTTYRVDKMPVEDLNKVGNIISNNKCGFSAPLDINTIMDISYKVGFQMKQLDGELLRGYEKSQIESIYEKYANEIFNSYADGYSGQMYFNSEEEFREAMLDKASEKHLTARLISYSALEQFAHVYSLDEMINDEERVKGEIGLGLYKRIAVERNMPLENQRKYTNNRESYAKLAKSWNESDLETYESIGGFSRYLAELAKSPNLSDEQRKMLNDTFLKVGAIQRMSAEDLAEHQEQVAEIMRDGIMDYEIMVREDFMDNVYTLNKNEVQTQTIQIMKDKEAEDFKFNGVVIDNEKELGTMLLHFFGQKDPERADEDRSIYMKRMIKEITEKRGLVEPVSQSDPEVISAMRHYEDVLENRTVVNSMVDSVWGEDVDGNVSKKMERNDLEHICTQTISAGKARKISTGSVALLFDKTRS